MEAAEYIPQGIELPCGFIFVRGRKMTQYLIMCTSLTNAQRSQRLLERAGINTSLVKAPQGLNTLGCGYSLSLYKGINDAVSLLKKNDMLKGKIFMRNSDSEYTEVKL